MVTRFAPFNEPEFEYMESYLEDMARKGLLLDNFGIVNAYFNEGEPCNRRYRIVPKILKSLKTDEISLYEEFGWHFVCKKGGTGLNILYTDDPNAPELFTDMVSFRSYAKKYAITGFISILLMLFYLINPFNTFTEIFQESGILHTIDEMGVFIIAVMMLTLLLLVAVVEAFVITQFSVAFRILTAKTMRRSIEYKGRLKFHKVTFIATISLAVILIMSGAFIASESADYDAEKAYAGNHPASYEIVDPEGWSTVEKAFVNNEWPEDVHFDVFTKTGILFDKKVEIYTDLNEDTYMRAVYRVARTERIAEMWLNEEILYDTNNKLQPEQVALDTPDGLDYLGYTVDEWDGQKIYMRKGNVLELIYYYGDKDVLQFTDEFVADLLL